MKSWLIFVVSFFFGWLAIFLFSKFDDATEKKPENEINLLYMAPVISQENIFFYFF